MGGCAVVTSHQQQHVNDACRSELCERLDYQTLSTPPPNRHQEEVPTIQGRRSKMVDSFVSTSRPASQYARNMQHCAPQKYKHESAQQGENACLQSWQSFTTVTTVWGTVAGAHDLGRNQGESRRMKVLGVECARGYNRCYERTMRYCAPRAGVFFFLGEPGCLQERTREKKH